MGGHINTAANKEFLRFVDGRRQHDARLALGLRRHGVVDWSVPAFACNSALLLLLLFDRFCATFVQNIFHTTRRRHFDQLGRVSSAALPVLCRRRHDSHVANNVLRARQRPHDDARRTGFWPLCDVDVASLHGAVKVELQSAQRRCADTLDEPRRARRHARLGFGRALHWRAISTDRRQRARRRRRQRAQSANVCNVDCRKHRYAIDTYFFFTRLLI